MGRGKLSPLGSLLNAVTLEARAGNGRKGDGKSVCVCFKLKSNDKIRYERQKKRKVSKTRRQYPVGSSWFPGWGSPGRS